MSDEFISVFVSSEAQTITLPAASEAKGFIIEKKFGVKLEIINPDPYLWKVIETSDDSFIVKRRPLWLAQLMRLRDLLR